MPSEVLPLALALALTPSPPLRWRRRPLTGVVLLAGPSRGRGLCAQPLWRRGKARVNITRGPYLLVSRLVEGVALLGVLPRRVTPAVGALVRLAYTMDPLA